MGMTPTNAKRLGQMIANARKRRGLSMRALADKLSISFAWLKQLEDGEYLDPSPDRLARIAEALDIEPARIDRLARGAVADSLPGMRMYFRAKYDLSPKEIDQIVKYMDRYIDGDRRAA